MTAGYNLKEGQYVNRVLTDDEMWSAFACADIFIEIVKEKTDV